MVKRYERRRRISGTIVYRLELIETRKRGQIPEKVKRNV
jgi:hypothetical protein